MDLALIHAYVCYRYEKCSSIYGNTHTIQLWRSAVVQTSRAYWVQDWRRAGGNRVQTNDGKKIGTYLELTQSDWLQNDAFCCSMQGIYNK